MGDGEPSGATGLVLLLDPGRLLREPLVAALDELEVDLELQVAADTAAFVAHLADVRPDVIVIAHAAQALDALVATVRLAAVRGPTLVVGGAADADRRRRLTEAGALTHLAGPAAEPRRLAQMVACVQRAGVASWSTDETRRHFEDILEASSDGICVLVDGRFHFVNQVFAQALGQNPAALVGTRSLLEFVVENEHTRVAEELASIEVSGGVRELVEIPLRNAQGREHRYEIAFRASVVDGRRALVGIARDVTAARDVQQEIDRARRRMAQVERLRALGELAAGVAHDFNNAVGTILGRAVLAEQKLQRGESVADDLAVITIAARNAAAVVQRIREFARPTGTDTWQDVDLTFILRETAALVKTSVPAAVELRTDIRPTPVVQGNGVELREVMLNLVRNALDAVGERGAVVLRARTEDGKAIVEVQDDGPGMSPDVQERLFEPFFTTKGERGTGLGLSVSRWILRRHDAQVDLRTAPGAGTTFRLTFTPLGAATRRNVQLAQGGLAILVVDDDVTVAEMIRDMLSEQGHHVLAVQSPGEAAHLLGSHSVDLMITDLDLPGMSGWQLARKVRELQPSIAVGLITGWPLGASTDELKARGIDFVVPKPFTIEALQAAIESTCGRPAATPR